MYDCRRLPDELAQVTAPLPVERVSARACLAVARDYATRGVRCVIVHSDLHQTSEIWTQTELADTLTWSMFAEGGQVAYSPAVPVVGGGCRGTPMYQSILTCSPTVPEWVMHAIARTMGHKRLLLVQSDGIVRKESGALWRVLEGALTADRMWARL
jgi:hypothetical protein